jgi:hypothetical protein
MMFLNNVKILEGSKGDGWAAAIARGSEEVVG